MKNNMKENQPMNVITLDNSSTLKCSQNSEKPNTQLNNNEKQGILSFKIKIIIFTLIGIITFLMASIIIITILYSKSSKNNKMEIADLNTEKSVLENQNQKLNEKNLYLTNLNENLNLTNIELNNKLKESYNEEIKKNKTYKTLQDISNEGLSLKTTFSEITKSIDKIHYRNIQLESNRELEEQLNTLQKQLELIKTLMEQISLKLELANQNKELLLININITSQLNQQIINNTLLLNENQNLIKEKIELNNELNIQKEKNKKLESDIKKLENELNESKRKFNQTCDKSNINCKEMIEELYKKINEEISNNTQLKGKILDLENIIENQNISLKNCLNKNKELEKDNEIINTKIQILSKTFDELIINNTKLLEENLQLKANISNCTIKYNGLDDNFNNFKKECKILENENNEIKLKNKKLGENIIQLNNSLITCQNIIETSKYNESILINNLSKCQINLNNVNILNKDLTNSISSLNQQYSECKTNLGGCRKHYDNLIIDNSNLKTEINSITTKYNQCINNYNICKNELSYYIKLPDEMKKLKEQIIISNLNYNNCIDYLNQCNIDCPIIEYNGITDEMKKTIQELIVYSYTKFSVFEQRAKYISDKMSEIYNKNKWSCVIGKSSSYWGYYVYYFNDLYYTYTYKSIKWVVFVGAYY